MERILQLLKALAVHLHQLGQFEPRRLTLLRSLRFQNVLGMSPVDQKGQFKMLI